MEKENLHELSTEELIKKKKSLKFAFGLMVGSLVISLIVTIFQTIKNGFQLLNITPFSLLPITAIIYNSITNINKELKSRNVNG
ncbi:hypothetical protein [Arcicella lustrica]|uniref:Redox-active disulfide protein 2 n=1 Tax=Arcicella lustrica TaxID=2984196 RepID=A0ABU5SE07_9BACT|nr:hypothetical protein [Arcicella sp. DC25W]MEA5425515.1 hypothetical protein [Arcicella sp. DC25W]